MSLLRRAPRLNLHLAAALLAFAYFAFHIVHGERGAVALLEARAGLAAAEAARVAAEAERDALGARVALLRPESLDADMLEEQARELLNFAVAGDYVLATEPWRSMTASRPVQ